MEIIKKIMYHLVFEQKLGNLKFTEYERYIRLTSNTRKQLKDLVVLHILTKQTNETLFYM